MRVKGARGAGGARGLAAGRAAWALGRGLGAGRAAWALGARLERWARGLVTRAGQGCPLGLFLAWFDSVLFLSQFLDIVHEPGS